ncbi:MAG: HIT family protein [Planctomycetes bacterium]|nr:HIT family protein [Planctomycetota bacterium]MCB9909531.1 HIT family protein [Planctomycetota bacterium]MCB9912502.1 HIT family protein [Planctomycetota bacterium]HPF15652.1 HIT family protein [Planctomycetota bacterium]HRV82052.1 HIT family protein [Planctomycetota bacterium]
MPIPTIFDRILDGEIPCHRVYEDEHVLSFLDVSPISRGHALVIPKERKAHLHELSDESAAAIGRVLPRIARAVMAATGCEHYNVLQNNGAQAHQSVFHVHFHVIPHIGDQGLGVDWKPGTLADGEALAQAIRAHLEPNGTQPPYTL